VKATDTNRQACCEERSGEVDRPWELVRLHTNQADQCTAALFADHANDALRADPVIQSALPNEMYKVFMHYKQDEWDRFRATVSEWDIETYLDVLP